MSHETGAGSSNGEESNKGVDPEDARRELQNSILQVLNHVIEVPSADGAVAPRTSASKRLSGAVCNYSSTA